MGRGRMGNSGSSGGRGSMGGGGHGSGFGGGRRLGRSHSHTTVVIGGHHRGMYHSSGSPWIGIIVGAIFVLVGLSIVFGGFGNLFKYSTVQATCVLNEKSGMWYYTTYDYTIDGVDYTNRSMQSWEFPEEVGKTVELYYLKSDPNKIYEEHPDGKSEAGIMIGAGFICAAMGALPLILCIKELKGKKSQVAVGETAGTVKEETHNRCPYCGARYSKNSSSCPKCGASKLD